MSKRKITNADKVKTEESKPVLPAAKTEGEFPADSSSACLTWSSVQLLRANDKTQPRHPLLRSVSRGPVQARVQMIWSR